MFIRVQKPKKLFIYERLENTADCKLIWEIYMIELDPNWSLVNFQSIQLRVYLGRILTSNKGLLRWSYVVYTSTIDNNNDNNWMYFRTVNDIPPHNSSANTTAVNLWSTNPPLMYYLYWYRMKRTILTPSLVLPDPSTAAGLQVLWLLCSSDKFYTVEHSAAVASYSGPADTKRFPFEGPPVDFNLHISLVCFFWAHFTTKWYAGEALNSGLRRLFKYTHYCVVGNTDVQALLYFITQLKSWTGYVPPQCSSQIRYHHIF